MYKVELSLSAEKFYLKCDKILTKKLVKCFQHLEQNPRSHLINYFDLFTNN